MSPDRQPADSESASECHPTLSHPTLSESRSAGPGSLTLAERRGARRPAGGRAPPSGHAFKLHGTASTRTGLTRTRSRCRQLSESPQAAAHPVVVGASAAFLGSESGRAGTGHGASAVAYKYPRQSESPYPSHPMIQTVTLYPVHPIRVTLSEPPYPSHAVTLPDFHVTVRSRGDSRHPSPGRHQT